VSVVMRAINDKHTMKTLVPHVPSQPHALKSMQQKAKERQQKNTMFYSTFPESAKYKPKV